MAKTPKDISATPEPKTAPLNGAVKPLKTRVMSLDKAKKLIRKTSAEHGELFRRLAK